MRRLKYLLSIFFTLIFLFIPISNIYGLEIDNDTDILFTYINTDTRQVMVKNYDISIQDFINNEFPLKNGGIVHLVIDSSDIRLSFDNIVILDYISIITLVDSGDGLLFIDMNLKSDSFYTLNVLVDYIGYNISDYDKGYTDAVNSYEEYYKSLIDNAFDKGFYEGELNERKNANTLRFQIINFIPGVLGSIFMFFFQLGQIGILGITILDILGILVLISGLIFLIKFFF